MLVSLFLGMALHKCTKSKKLTTDEREYEWENVFKTKKQLLSSNTEIC